MATAVVILGVLVTALSIGGLAGWFALKIYDWFTSREDKEMERDITEFEGSGTEGG